MNNTTQIKVPGKLFLAGEYAVTTPGQPALIKEVNRGINLTLTSDNTSLHGQISLQSSQYQAAFNTDWSAVSSITSQALKTGSWTFVRAALAVFMEAHSDLHWSALPNVTLFIHSTMKDSSGKLGLGSSAAVTVAVVKSLHTAFLATVNPLTVFKEAAFAHYLVQGSGSLGDIATAAYGNTIYYQSPGWLAEKKAWCLSDFTKIDWKQLVIKPVTWPKDWSFAIIASSEPASTRKALAKQTDLSKLLPQSKAAVEKAYKALVANNYNDFRTALNENQKALLNTLPEGYETKKLASFLQIIKRLELAGKISGAGFGDNGFVVGNQDHSLFPVRTASRFAGLHFIESDI